ncbi:hypothetical protein DFH11DRAFT_1539769 [Phellopilus nigrolimitatus]|nr:hypothetical protein DFH11DRAFT_1539769 [Phellopilus nigrolimitatus]
MVYVNSKKYACESCIKGHRSSSCHHNDRPLFEIKKKGRPVSQCEKCREARQARRIHGKCTCATEREAAAASAAAGEGAKKKGKRFVPSVPSLPNGLKDAFSTPESSAADIPGPKWQVDALLNPCHCKDVYNCRCGRQAERSSSLGSTAASSSTRPISSTLFSDGLSALALVASCCSPASSSTLLSAIPTPNKVSRRFSSNDADADGNTSDAAYSLPPLVSHLSMDEQHPVKRKRSPNSPSGAHRKLPNSNDGSQSKLFRPIAPAPPPSLIMESTVRYHAHPAGSVIAPPNLSSVPASASNGLDTLEDGTNCCCGTRCECAGCSVHDVPSSGDSLPTWVDDSSKTEQTMSHFSSTHTSGDCTPDCPTCVDHDGGVELPQAGSVPGVSTGQRLAAPSFLDAFFARAASLPAPPSLEARKHLDPTNVVLYPRSLFGRDRSSDAKEDRPRAFNLVNLPKLEECCGGRCGCMEDACECGDACGGCCMDSGNEARAADESAVLEGASHGHTPVSPSLSFARQSITPTNIPRVPVPP